MSTEETEARILVELAKLSANVDAVRKDGIDRGRRTDANHKILTETVRTQSERISTLEERQAQTEHVLQRSNSGFARSMRHASEADAKRDSDLAAVIVAVKEMAAQKEKADAVRSFELGNFIVQSVRGMAPDKRALWSEALLKVFIAVALILSALASYLQSKGH